MAMPGLPQYEFNEEQNALIGGLAARMRFVGMFLIVLGVLALVGAAATARDVRDGHLVVFGIFQIVLGAWTRSAAKGFRQVVETQGADINHLMEALADLRKLYTLQYWLVILALVVLVITLVTTELLLRGRGV
jgi:hypothetical protein